MLAACLIDSSTRPLPAHCEPATQGARAPRRLTGRGDRSASNGADQFGRHSTLTEVAIRLTASRRLNESNAKMRISRVKFRSARLGPAGMQSGGVRTSCGRRYGPCPDDHDLAGRARLGLRPGALPACVLAQGLAGESKGGVAAHGAAIRSGGYNSGCAADRRGRPRSGRHPVGRRIVVGRRGG
jgi:hypothetical protein